MKRIFLSIHTVFVLVLIFSSCCFADEPHVLKKIVVKSASLASSDNSLKETYPTDILSNSDIREKNLATLADIMDYVPGLELRYRGTSGIQGDLSMRGSTYEEVALLIDGVNIMDPQTGHHNLDIPLTIFDVERIEVIKEGVSSLYGQGGFAGGINIVTKKPLKKSVNLDTVFGEHALFGQTFSLSFPQDAFSGRVSFDHKISKAARPNTDFEYKTASLYLSGDFDGVFLDSIFGYQKKDFGADSFYSNLFPEEEEHTETIFTRTGLKGQLHSGSVSNNIFFRKHRDKFILRRNNPTSVNYHTTFVYGFDSSFNFSSEYGEMLLGINAGKDEINSTNLGKHSRLHEAGSIGFIPHLGEKLNADIRFRLDHYQKWNEQESYNIGVGYKITDKATINSSFAHAFRLPTFTELYYSDAANKGNAELKTEESDTFNIGASFKDTFFEADIGCFLRRGSNLIDWTRASTADRWEATNLGRVDFRGTEFSLALKPGINTTIYALDKVKFSYAYTDADRKAAGFLSKYALDILKHHFNLGIYSSILGLDFNCYLSYKRRYYSETYFVGDLYIGKKITCRGLIFEPFVRIDNFTNAQYSETGGVLQPRRWIKSGVKFEW